jgi:heat shock protein HslJ
MKNTITKLAALAIFAALLTACASNSPNGLAGTSWTLTSLDGSAQVGAAVGGSPITIEFDAEGRAGGSSGCNSYGADYSTNPANGITISQAVSTLMACMDQLVMENEAAFLQALSAITSYEIDGDTLTLAGGGHTLIFTR